MVSQDRSVEARIIMRLAELHMEADLPRIAFVKCFIMLQSRHKMHDFKSEVAYCVPSTYCNDMHGGHLIREARRRAGLTQAELAERLSTAQPNVARWESADMSPSVDMLTRVIQACGLDLLVRLVPREAGDWNRVEDSTEINLNEKVEKIVGFVDTLEDGNDIKVTAKSKRTLKTN